MARSHSHREGGPICRFTTKKECDEAYKAALLELKTAYDTAQAEKAASEKAARIARFDAFIAKERKRMESYAKETR